MSPVRKRPNRKGRPQARGTSIENPNIPITDPRIWRHYFGSTEGDSGISLSVDRLLEYSPIWSGVRCISCDIAQIPLYVLRRDGKGKERAKNHPAFKLLRRQSNAEMTASTWKQTMVTHALLYGRAYSWIVRDNGARPRELLPIHPESVSATHDNPSGRLMYRVHLQSQRSLPPMFVDPEDMFVLLGLTLDGLDGLSLIEYARNSVGRALAAEKHSNRFFKNNANPGGILVHPNRLDDVALRNLRESWGQLHEGGDNAYRFAILEEGMEWKQVGISPEDSQLIESLRFGVKDAARLLGIPNHRLGDESKTSFASLEQENLSYQESTLGPWFDKFQEESYAKLLSSRERERDTHTVEFERNKILQADAATRHQVYAVGLQNGFYNRDEVRAWENLNPLPDGAGEEYFVPLNMTMASEQDSMGPEPPEAEAEEEEEEDEVEENSSRTFGTKELADVADAQRALMADACERAGKRLAHYFEQASRDGASFCRAVDDIGRHAQVIQDMLSAPVGSARALGFGVPEARELADRYLQMWARAMDGVARTATAEDLRQRANEIIETVMTGGIEAMAKLIEGDGNHANRPL